MTNKKISFYDLYANGIIAKLKKRLWEYNRKTLGKDLGLQIKKRQVKDYREIKTFLPSIWEMSFF